MGFYPNLVHISIENLIYFIIFCTFKLLKSIEKKKEEGFYEFLPNLQSYFGVSLNSVKKNPVRYYPIYFPENLYRLIFFSIQLHSQNIYLYILMCYLYILQDHQKSNSVCLLPKYMPLYLPATLVIVHPISHKKKVERSSIKRADL